MRILVFTEGTVIMHASAAGLAGGEIARQVASADPAIRDWSSYMPVGHAVSKLSAWCAQGAEIKYLTSRTEPVEVVQIEAVLRKYGFPSGQLLFRCEGEHYGRVAERVMPDILVEDDCRSIGGQQEMVYTHISSEMKAKIKSIPIAEFGGIDHLPDSLSALVSWDGQ